MAAVESLPVHHHSAEYITFRLGSMETHNGIFENLLLLMYTLEGVIRTVFFVYKDNLSDNNFILESLEIF